MADTEQAMVTEQEQRAAVALLRASAASGELTGDEAARREAAVWQSVTPRDLWKATGGLAGHRRRADWREWRRAAAGTAAVWVFAAVALALLLLAMQSVDIGPSGSVVPGR